jgi:hypothetical protein
MSAAVMLARPRAFAPASLPLASTVTDWIFSARSVWRALDCDASGLTPRSAVALAASASLDNVLRALSALVRLIRLIASTPASRAVMTAMAAASREMR